LTLHVIAAGNRLRTLDYPTNDIVQDEVNHRLYASVSSSSSTNPNSIIAIDPLQGVVVATRAMSGQPTKLAISDDGSYLYISLPVTGEISRLQLPSLTPDIQWSLKNSGGVGYSAVDMAVAPGQPHTLAVTGLSLNIYDDSTRRSLTPTTGYPLPTFDTIAWGSDATTLYATSAVTSGGPEYVFSVDQNGPTLTRTINSVFGDFPKRLIYDQTTSRIYDGYGNVADPATGSPAGQFNVRNDITYIANPFAVDSAHSKAFFLNVSDFSSPQTVDIQAFDLMSFGYINTITTPNLSGSKIVPWGSSGVAVGGGTKIFLIDGSFVSSTGTSSQTGSYIAVSPTLDTISPQTVTAGSGPVDITLNGRDFSESSVVTWNGHALSISSQTTTQIVVTIPASLLATPITTPVTVSNGAGTENSAGVSFAVLPDLGPNLQISAISISGQDMAWDATRGRLYVAMTDGAPISGGSIGVVDPATTTLSNVVATGGNPGSLGLSDDGHYLYTGFQTTNSVKRFTLPDFSLDLTIPLNSGSLLTSHAEDVKVAPGNPHTVAITMGSNQLTPRGAGGLAVFDDAVSRSAKLTTGVYKVAWGKDSNHLFAQSDPNISSQSLYILSADGNGVVQQAISGSITNLGLRPHYDLATNLIYGDGGRVSDPADASAAGVFQATRGLMVPDSDLNRAFFLRLNTTNPFAWIYELDIFDLKRQTLLKTIPIPAVSGYPTQLVRWGNQGLAFLTYGQASENSPGMLYILQGSDITGIDTPPPGSITLSPASVIAGASAQATITVNGTGFQQTSAILVNGTAQQTTYISPTQLSFQLSAADQSFANYLAVVVTDAATGISSPAASLSVNNPAPLISSLSSPKLPVHSADTKVTLSGTGFMPTTTVLFNGNARATTYIAPNQVSVVLPYSDFASAGTYTLTAVNPTPGGGTAAAALEIDNPLPSITTVSPTTVLTGSPAKTIFVYGAGFVSGTQILVNGTPRSTNYATPSNVSASLTAADFALPGSVSIVAVNPGPGGGSSAAASVAVNNGLPGPITLNPSAVTQGVSPPTTITITGSNFTPSAYVLINNSQRPTTYVSSTQLSFSLTVADQASVATKVVTVVNPPPNGGSSSAYLSVVAATGTPVISTVYPTQFVAGMPDSFLSVTGTGFNTSSVVRWNGDPLFTYGGSSSSLSATVPSSLIAHQGTATITVETSTATPSTSNAVSVSIVLPAAPTVTSISPSYGPIHTGFTGTITGSNFTSNSTVTFNGEAVPTSFVNSNQLTAVIPDSAVVPGNSNVAVFTSAPGGGTSQPLVYTAYIPIANNSMVYNAVDHLFYLSVPGSAEAPYANSIVSLDPLTGTLGTPILVGSEPNHLALSSDGKSIWVGLDGASAVRKVDLVSRTAGLQFSLPNPASSSDFALKAIALAAVPGQTNSVIVSAGTGQPFGALLAIYDSGVPRNGVSQFPASMITVDGSKSEVYVAQNGGYQTYTYDSYGLRLLGTGHPDSAVSFGYDDRLQLSDDRIYTDAGKILDAETAATIGTFSPTTSTPSSTTIDPALNLAFVLDSTVQYASLPDRIQVFKMSDFTPSGSSSIPVNIASAYDTSLGAPLSKLTRWGSNGLAFRAGSRVYALRSSLVKDLTASPADLGVTLSISGATTTGAQTIYTATITNVGPQPSSEIVLSSLAPSTGVLTSVTSASGTCAIATDATCNLGSLAAGASASVVFTVSQLTPGSSTLTVNVTASQADPNPIDNQASSTTAIAGDAYSPLPVVISMSPSEVLAGSGDVTVTLSGSGFTSGSTVMADDTPLPTTVMGPSELKAVIRASSVSTLGWHLITVSNPAPGGGLSAGVPLTVYRKIKAGANHIVYDPFSRRILASLGSVQPLGNSIVSLEPETGDLDTPSLVGSEPTRMDLSDDANFLYVLASGEDQIVRYNMRTRQPEFSFKLPTNAGTYNTSTTLFSIQPGSENTLAVNTPNGPAGEIVDFDPLSKQAAARPSTLSFADVGGEPRFLDASTLIFASQLSRYTVTPSGIGSFVSSMPVVASALKIDRGVAYTDAGNIADVTSLTTKNLGTFVVQHIYYSSQADNFVPDPLIGRVYFNATPSNGTYDVQGGTGVAAFDTNTLTPVNYTPFAVDPSPDGTPIKGVDLVRWGQDGLASLNSSGTIFLMRGPAVLPQLLGTSTPPTLAGVPQAIQHGSGNTMVILTGSNFLPGVAAFWNGSYRTTTLVDSTHITMDIPYTDLLSSGSAAITCSNPGSSASAPVAIGIN
jgi:sugar lactone lactonase YvrE